MRLSPWRLLLAYLAASVIPSLLWMILTARKGVPSDVLIAGPLLYTVFSFAALVALGTPLLLLFRRLRWTGFLPFGLAGASCAFVTAYAMLSNGPEWWTIRFFTVAGAAAALCFRAIVFGFRNTRNEPRPSASRMPVLVRTVAAVFSTALALAFLFWLYSVADQHRTVSLPMGWQCVDEQTVKLWFRSNPRYEERASGPQLCAQLQSSGQETVQMGFTVWGNPVRGLHGYNQLDLRAAGRKLPVTSFSSGGYHGDSSQATPDLNPLDVFR